MQDQLILSRYRPIDEAGSGGFATVQLAWDTRIQRRVAIKCIQMKDEDFEQAVTPGLDEARTAAMLNDPSIVGVYDFEVQGSTAYLIMEYVDGMSLTKLLEEFGDDLSLDTVATIFSSIARALEVAHDNQVLHLDIKPDNILINRQGQVKVSDFGLATLSDALGFGSARGGTIGYMPLEQMRQEPLDSRCDEWALASILYEMLVGDNPFFAKSLKEAERTILDAEIVLPSLCMEGLDAEADEVIFKALDPEREERYDSISDFADEMEPYLGDFDRGQKELAVFVGDAREDWGEEEEQILESLTAFERMGRRGKALVARVFCAVEVAFLGYLSLVNIAVLEGASIWLFWGLLALLVAASLIKPHLGALLTLFTFAAALIYNGAYIVGILCLVLSLAWWLLAGRKGDWSACVVLTPPLFGAFGLAQIAPLMSGFFLRMKDALISSFLAFFLALVLAGFGSESIFGWGVFSFWQFSDADIQANILGLLKIPSITIMVVFWLGATALLRLFSRRGRPAFAFFGVIVASLLLLAGALTGSWIETGQLVSSWYLVAASLFPGLIMTCACLLGVPVPEEDLEEA